MIERIYILEAFESSYYSSEAEFNDSVREIATDVWTADSEIQAKYPNFDDYYRYFGKLSAGDIIDVLEIDTDKLKSISTLEELDEYICCHISLNGYLYRSLFSDLGMAIYNQGWAYQVGKDTYLLVEFDIVDDRVDVDTLYSTEELSDLKGIKIKDVTYSMR